jgi:hypothetical protein
MTNVRYQARPAAKRPRPVFWAVPRSALAAALGLVLPWYLQLASTCFLMERTAAANFTRLVRALRR